MDMKCQCCYAKRMLSDQKLSSYNFRKLHVHNDGILSLTRDDDRQ